MYGVLRFQDGGLLTRIPPPRHEPVSNRLASPLTLYNTGWPAWGGRCLCSLSLSLTRRLSVGRRQSTTMGLVPARCRTLVPGLAWCSPRDRTEPNETSRIRVMSSTARLTAPAAASSNQLGQTVPKGPSRRFEVFYFGHVVVEVTIDMTIDTIPIFNAVPSDRWSLIVI